MIREEAIKYIKSQLCSDCSIHLGGGRKCPSSCFVNQVIEALEEPVLDKIRTEIEQTPTVIWEENKKAYIFASYFKKQVLQIIDKYRKE